MQTMRSSEESGSGSAPPASRWSEGRPVGEVCALGLALRRPRRVLVLVDAVDVAPAEVSGRQRGASSAAGDLEKP